MDAASSDTVLVSEERRSFANFVLRVKYRLPEGGGRLVIRHTGSDDVMTGYHMQGFSGVGSAADQTVRLGHNCRDGAAQRPLPS